MYKTKSLRTMSQLSELKNGADYESALQKSFQNLKINRNKAPKEGPALYDNIQEVNQGDSEEKIARILKPNLLTLNLVESNIRTITSQPGIITYVKNKLEEKEELNEFNKYFTIFKKSLGNIKIASGTMFMSYWEQFKKENLGSMLPTTELLPEPEVEFSKKDVPNITKYENMTSKEINDLFVQALEKVYNTTIDKITFFQYPLQQRITGTKKPKMSVEIPFHNTEGMLTFTTKNALGKTDLEKMNNIKIKVILYAQNQEYNFTKIKPEWTGSKKGKEVVTKGSGFIVPSNEILAKKKSVPILFP